MKKLKIIGIICFGVLAFAGITQCNAPGGENNLFAGLVCLFIAIGLSFPPSQKSIKKQGKTNMHDTVPCAKHLIASDGDRQETSLSNNSLETDFHVEYRNTYPDDYLDQILPDGRTIREVRKESLEEALSSIDCRTDEEENLISDFYTEFQETLTLAEEKLYQLANDIGQGKTLDDRILKVRKVISHYEHFKSFCYSNGLGGQMYFQDMWEHCHNSKNPDFDYIDQFKEMLENWIARRDERDEMASTRKQIIGTIKENPGILQKDIYKHFSPDLKNPIRGEMMNMESDGIIRRTKHGNTYELYIN